jgi:hypothetical protein
MIIKELEVKYGSGKTIFIEHCNDMFSASVPTDMINLILEHCWKFTDNTYVFQSKNPARFIPFVNVGLLFPPKIILGTTIETNRNIPDISKAPRPRERAEAMVSLPREIRKFITVEPVLDFDVDILAGWIAEIRPEFLNLGADSKGHNLPEPTLDKILALTEKLAEYGIELREKHNLERLKG